MRKLRRRAFLSTLVGSSSVVVLAACSLAAPSAGGPASSKAGGGTLNILMASEPVTLDPQFSPGTSEDVVSVNIQEGLFTTGENLAVVPKLAESYAQIDDNTWEFKLRQGIKFHNGEAFDAAAVKATYERSEDQSLKIRNTWASDVNIDHIDAVDAATVRFYTKTPTPHMLARIANDHYMYPPQFLKDTDPKDLARKAVGTGPYVFKEWASGDHITLEANPNYWGPKPSIQTVVWRFAPENTTRVSNLRTGSADFVFPVDPGSIADVNSNSQLQVASMTGGRRVYVGFNTSLKPVDDVRVRQALNYGLDVESICKTILAGATSRMRTWVNPPNENPDVKGYAYDPAKAKQLLADAGLGSGFSVTFDVDNGAYLGSAEFPQAIATSLREIGISVNINAIDRTVAAQMQRDRNTHEMYLRSTAPAYDPGLDFDLLRLNHAGNGTNWNDPEFQTLFKMLYSGGTQDQRRQWSFQAQARLMDQAPMLFLWKEPSIYGLNKKVQGFKPTGDERVRVVEFTLSA